MIEILYPAEIDENVTILLSPLDAVMNTYRIVLLYIYPPPPPSEASYDLETLQNSFKSLVDEDYPVLVGSLYFDPKTGSASVKQSPLARKQGASGIRFETNSANSQSTDNAIASLSWDFMPKTRINGEIIAVKGSILTDGGMAIGVDCSHVVFDGEAILTFMRAWGQRYSGVDQLVINHDRFLLSGTGESYKFPHPEFLISPTEPLIRKEDGSLVPTMVAQPPPTGQHVFHLSPLNMAKLKKMAENSQETEDSPRFQDPNARSTQPAYISTVDAITALFTILISQARGHGQNVRVSTAVNGRKRFEPPLPVNYSGNAVFHALSSHTNDDLVECTTEKLGSTLTLSRVARRIRTSILKREDEFLRDTVAFLASQTDPSSINDNVNFFFGTDIAFTCWAKMGLYEAKFDGIRPLYAKIPRVKCMDGFVLITEAANGNDGLDVLVCLECLTMNKLLDLCINMEFLQN